MIFLVGALMEGFIVGTLSCMRIFWSILKLSYLFHNVTANTSLVGMFEFAQQYSATQTERDDFNLTLEYIDKQQKSMQTQTISNQSNQLNQRDDGLS